MLQALIEWLGAPPQSSCSLEAWLASFFSLKRAPHFVLSEQASRCSAGSFSSIPTVPSSPHLCHPSLNPGTCLGQKGGPGRAGLIASEIGHHFFEISPVPIHPHLSYMTDIPCVTEKHRLVITLPLPQCDFQIPCVDPSSLL